MLRDEVEKYSKLTGEDGWTVPIIKVGAFLDGYEKGREDAVKHGRWIIKDNPGTGWYRITCSECGEDVTSSAPCLGWMPVIKVLWDYCPDCGAKMEEVDNE